MTRLRVGVVGCGVVSQVMHLPYLRELADRFELRALCDISPGTLDLVADAYGIPADHRFADWHDLVADDLDAIVVATNDSHAPCVIAAAEAGRHVFVEKPLCFSPVEADRVAAVVAERDVCVMVGYMKRFDPAFETAQRRVAGIDDLRYVRLTTLEAPADDYLVPYPILRRSDAPPDVLARAAATRATLVREAIGAEAGPDLERAYIETLLDSAIHELNMLRALAGEPEAVVSAEFWDAGRSLQVVFGFPGELRASLGWITLPGLRRYRQEIACYGPDERLTIAFPSPYLRNAPTTVTLEEQDESATWERELIASYDEAFRRELIHFHDCAVNGTEPRTNVLDARRDIDLARAIVAAAVTGRPVAPRMPAAQPAAGRATPDPAAVEAGTVHR